MTIKLKEVYKSFGEREILKNISIDVESGETLAIVGPSGSGKTTLLNLIGALDKPDKGVIIINNQNLKSLPESKIDGFRMNQVGFIFQMHYLLPQCSLLENVLIPTLTIRNKIEKQKKYLKAVELLERVGLSEQINQKPGELSGGECQRTAFVRAIINNPGLILADEPTGSLDQESAEKLEQLLLELNKEGKTTLIVVTHSLNLAKKMNKIYRLKNGELI